MRLFVSVPLTKPVTKSLEKACDSFRREGVTGRFVPAENFHVTLAFIGEWPDPEKVLKALENVTFKPFTISVSGTGTFGSLLYARVTSGGRLEKLASAVRKALKDAGIPMDPKPFRAHVTLIRDAQFSARSEQSVNLSCPEQTVDRFSLMISRFDPDRHTMRYQPYASLFAERN